MFTQLLILLLLLLPSILLLTHHLRTSHHPQTRPKTAIVLVLGDVGRSPRMMYHARSLVKNGYKVWLVGYRGTPPLKFLEESEDVVVRYIPPPPEFLERVRLPFLVKGPAKVIYQVVGMIKILSRYPERLGAEYILIQNPPSIPTLLLAQLASFIRGSKLIIDWHNTGYSILALKLGNGHPLVKIARWFEKTFGRKAFAHLFVTDAMKMTLSKNWALEGQKVVLHDRPPQHFRQSTPAEIHELFERLIPTLSPPLLTSLNQTDLFSTQDPVTHQIALRADRPALVVSSTSWTPDEDFTVLISALDTYERLRTSLSRPPTAPRPHLRKRRTPPLVVPRHPMEDYPVFLGSADLGVSLHSSSSGLDLPMKVVDLFGCGVPVLARNFQCLGELVMDGENGRIFNTSADLAHQLADTLQGFPEAPKLQALRAYCTALRGRSEEPTGRRWGSWDQQWAEVVKPVLEKKDL
ncbi:hypothetical protein QFC20_006977 [Naganishia adeliensis]|uniref:Uncharacterized protein n=1 Tax=Naganishia adeliensis TaxID=92952 RepID=A0ACC2V4G6_9TREE|nr:hypothetical protein QFC20_006977 [Naganishia adeliensis]